MALKKIMIADDDPSLCRLLTVRCENLGLSVMTAPDAMQALVMIHKNMPVMIVMDISMPAGHGLSACEMLANDPRLAKIPVVVFSGSACPDDMDRCSAMNVDFVQKNPDSWPMLQEIICAKLNISPDASSSPKAAGRNAA